MPTTGTCLLFAAKNISKGEADFNIHCTFTMRNVTFGPGDSLEYDLYLDPANPEMTGSIDAQFHPTTINPWDPAAKRNLRDFVETTAGLSNAVGKWEHFKIPLDAVTSRTSGRWNLVFDGRKEGQYAMFIDNIHVTGPTGLETTLYSRENPTDNALDHREGYSQYFTLVPVSREKVRDGEDVSAIVKAGIERAQLRREAGTVHREMVALGTNDKIPPQDTPETSPTLAELNDLATTEAEDLDAEHFQETIHRAEGMLAHLHPEMRKYTGHMVGHAHIDFQWLWPWTETIQVCKATFGQAVKFMDEFESFCFTQSSPSLYKATEENFPDIFKKIQEHVADGKWEIAGGRWCEGDENMISPESHARHFLYGQRYFREKFQGKNAIVGWEPDTFGHVWTMPQILKLGGCKYYYFCRAGHGKPLFWWQGPDGTKVLAFEEPVYGTWYNADLNAAQFEESLKFEKDTGSRDMLWVYGVGNHGGGATREQIENGREWQKKEYLPTAKFSTATEFFHRLEQYDLGKISTIATDLNTTSNSGFVGVYTTHSDIKKWNRDSETMTESAEAIAAYASRFGFQYPTAEFRRNWQDILWNHHHDTLPGTSIHSSYDVSEKIFRRVMDSSTSIGQQALDYIAAGIAGHDGDVVVFNPVGWEQDQVVEVKLPEGASSEKLVAWPPEGRGKHSPVQPLAGKPGYAAFEAWDVPPFGYKTFSLKSSNAKKGIARKEEESNEKTPSPPTVSADGSTLENSRYRVKLDRASGQVISLYDKRSKYEAIAPGKRGNRLEVHKEAPNGMSAWQVGEKRGVESLNGPVDLRVVESGPVRVKVEWSQRYGASDLLQSISMTAHGAPDFALSTQWKELGSSERPSPFLKVAFDLNVTSPTVTYDIPFGNIERPADGWEYPALKWVDAADTTCGAALLNNCKHGYSMKGNVLRLSLIRSSYYPDASPNERPQTAHWSLVPHAGNWREAHVLQQAVEFNKPFWVTTAKRDSGYKGPVFQSAGTFVSSAADDVIITGVKKAEDDNSLVVRYYEAYGKKAAGYIRTIDSNPSATRVNFIEDDLSSEGPANADMRAYEIRTVKFRSQ